MKKLILILALTFTSCSSWRITPKHDGFNKEFADLKQQFIQESKGAVTEKDFQGLTMDLVDYPDNVSTVGTCWPMGFFTEIDISRKDWDAHPTMVSGAKTYNNLWKKELVYHELGHCLLGKNHSEKTLSDGFVGTMERFAFNIGWWTPKGYLKDKCPASLMHPYMVGPYCFGKHYDYYIAEFFTEHRTNRNRLPTNARYKKKKSNKKACGAPQVVNRTNTWTRGDQQTLKRAYRTCIEDYNSCLKTLVKTEELAYQAVCGDNYVD